MSKEELFLNIISKTLNDNSFLGDDCAFLKDFGIYVTCDNLIEDVHFNLKTTNYRDLGYKSVAVNLSDLASNLSTPKYILIGLSVPKNISSAFIKEFYSGVNDICTKYNVKVAGGDITSASKICISIVALGSSNNIKSNRKNILNEGDIICTTGEYGSSAFGFKLLNSHFLQKNYNKDIIKHFILKHIKPEPCILEMNNIIESIKDSKNIAMMDTSDGLGDALYKLATTNSVSFNIDFKKIPVNNVLKKIKNYKNYVLWGAEDYELLLVINKDDYLKLNKNLFYQIGTVTKKIHNKPVIINYENNNYEVINKKTYNNNIYNHFKEK